MGNVWEAMKKHQAEKAEKAVAAGDNRDGKPAAPPAPTQSDSVAPTDAASPVVLAGVAATVPKGDPRSPRPRGADGYSPLLAAHHDRGGALAEEYRGLRTSLLAQCQDQRFCFMVTSSEAGEGKTLTCANLAVIMAERQDRKTIVLDFDLRKCMIAGLFNGRQGPGVAEVIRGTARLDDVMQPTVYPTLFFVSAGEVTGEEVGELVTRPEMDEMVAELRRRFDYVMLDTPPINIVAETGMIGRAVGEALLVVQMNKTRRESVDKAIRLLHAANIKLAGLVLTHRTYHIPGYLYKYS
jgi:capsular exopolysaccharide synthesis family protein